MAAARERGLEPPVGNILSSDVFYHKTHGGLEWAPMGVLAIDMETAGLYAVAAEAGKRALTICTSSSVSIFRSRASRRRSMK